MKVETEEVATTAGRKRRPFRREQILEAAIALFNRKGYHGTGMNDIGAEVGLTGPAIYRHFDSKEAILETAVRRAGEQMLNRLEAIVHGDLEPVAAMEALIENYITTLLDYPALSNAVMIERRALSDETREWVERRLRLHATEWATTLRRCRPHLSEADAALMVNAAFLLATAVHQYPTHLTAERSHQLLASMIRAALLDTEIPG